jgi:hypothetical protein
MKLVFKILLMGTSKELQMLIKHRQGLNKKRLKRLLREQPPLWLPLEEFMVLEDMLPLELLEECQSQKMYKVDLETL